jgi:hypothetical protein
MSEPEDDTGTGHAAIAIRETSGAAIIKAVPIPAQLQELGVRIAEEENTGLRVIVLPANVRQAVNLLTPVSSWNQADPNWTPSISLVQLDKDAHTYFLPGGKLGLNKQALETLGRCAGVLYTRTTRVRKEELQEGEMWAYRATVGFRRSDGTVDEVTRERGFNREAEQLDIETAVRGSDKFKTPAAQDAEIKKRWIAELRFGPGKTESKAINRALRAGLAMPASVTAASLQKPFLVVGFNFTPDYTDPIVKRALVAVGLNAQAAIYGGREPSEDMPEHGAADIPMAALEQAEPAVEPQVPTLNDHPADGGGEGGAVREEATADSDHGDGAAAASSAPPEPALDDDESESAEDVPLEGPEHDPPPAQPNRTAGGMRIPEAAIEAAGAVEATTSGKTIADVVRLAGEGDQRALAWLTWARDTLPDDDQKRQALELYATARAPEMWANLG